MLNPFAAVVRTVRRLVRMRRMEHRHGFPCVLCGAKTFEEAGNLCRGYYDCCGDRMSKEVFHPNVTGLLRQAQEGASK